LSALIALIALIALPHRTEPETALAADYRAHNTANRDQSSTMPHRRLMTTALAGLLATAALAVAVPAGGTPPDPLAAVAGGPASAPRTPDSVPAAPPADPFPIRRTFLTGDRLAAALADAARGALTRLPREEFEAKVRTAAARAAAPAPRLAEARYKATLADGGLTGTAEWRVAGAGLLPLDPLGPAVSNPRWADGSPAAVVRAEPPGKPAGFYLLADRPGDDVVSLHWSARGTEEPGAERFDLAFPPAPVAALELDLPADRVPAASPDQLVTGPLPGPVADRQFWRVAFGGQPRVDLAVRRPHRPGEPGPAVRVGRSARYDLSPGLAACTFELDLVAVRGQPDEFVIEADPGLRVTDVTGPGRLAWRAEPGEPTRVSVTARDPAAVGRVTVTGFAALPASGAWACPQVRLAGGLPGADAVELRIDPELKFIGCDPGGYRVTTAGAADRGYRIALAGALVPPGGDRPDRRPPTVRVLAAGPEYSSVEEVAWRVAAGRTDVAARFRVRVTRGPLVQVPVQVPPGCTVESVRLVPDDPGVPTAPQPGPNGMLLVEPSRPVASGQAVEVRVDLRGPPAPAAPDPASAERERTWLPFPQVTVARAAEREGLLTVSVSPAFRAWPTPASGERRAASGEQEETPSGSPPARAAAFTYPYRGRPPDGRLALAPRRPRVTATGDTTVSLDEGELTAATALAVRCEDGEFGSLTLFAPTPPGVRWEVRADGAEVRPLAGGGIVPWAGALAASPWSAAVGFAAAVPGSMWRVSYPRPATGPVVVTATARVPAPADPDATAWVPLPAVLGAAHAPPQVTLTPQAAARFEPAGASSAGTVALRPRGAAPPPPAALGPGWAFTGVGLVTRVDADGGLDCTFAGTATAATVAALPVELPNGARLTAALVAGRYVDRPAADGRRVELPLPAAGPSGTPFEVRYRLLGKSEAVGFLRPVARFDSPVPGLPADPGAVAISWTLDPEFRRWPELDAPGEPADGDAELTAVSVTALAAVGYIAAAVVLAVGAGLLARGVVRRRWVVAFAVAAAALGAAVLLAPEGWAEVLRPPLAVGLLALAGLALLTARPPGAAAPGGRPPLPSTVTHGPSLALLVALLAVPSAAQAPEPAAVFVVPGPPSTPDRLAVLAPPAVLERLDALARSPAPEAVVTAAEYDGSAAAADAPATFTAKYDVLCAADGEHALALALAGVRLEGMELDGKPAFPDGSRPDRYVVTVRGAGRHVLTARFAVTPAAVGADREVKFVAPDVACCRVRFAAPAGATRLDVASRRGAQADSRDGDRPRADADHGGGRAVTVRWRDRAAGGAAAAVAVREACVWDLTESGAWATAAFLYRIDGGSVDRLRVEFPDGLEPGGVIVRAGGEGRTGPGLRDWQLGDGPDGWKSLTLGLQSPAVGRVTVVVKFFPRRPESSRPVLRFPRAAGVPQAEGYYAVRLSGVVADDLARVGVIDFAAESLPREVAAVSELMLDRSAPDRVFQRSGGPAPEVRPALRPAGDPAGGSAEVIWTVGPRAEAEGAVRGGKGPTPLVEFDLSAAVRLDEVRCPDLQTWGRTGSRVQVWLRKPAREPVVGWTGALAGYPPKDGPPPEPLGVELPFARPAGGGPTTVRVRAAEGWAVAPQQTRGLKPLPPGPVAEEDYLAEPGAPPPRFQVFAPHPPGSAAVLETAERVGHAVRYRAVVRVPVAGGRPHRFALRLVGLPAGAETGVRGPEGVTVTRAEAGADRAAWEVSAPPTAAGPLDFALTATLPLPARLPRPAVSFGGPPVVWSGRALVADPALTASDGPLGWRPAGSELSRLRSAWPAEANRLATGRTWVADDPAGRWSVAVASGERPRSDERRAVGGEQERASSGSPPTAQSSSLPDGSSLTADRSSLARAAVWVAGLAAMLALARWGGRGWWPEVLAGCGLLGVVAVGAVFWAVVAVGAAARIGWLARRVARVAMR
jgi:hypothetical protein